MEDEITKLDKALLKHLSDESLTPSDTLVGLLKVNGASKPNKMSRRELESYTSELVLDQMDYRNHLPQRIPLTASFVEDVLDPVTTVAAPTGLYRVTMRKLLRLTLTQLQQQAELMELDVLVFDEEGIAAAILINMKQNSPLILPLARMLISKEIAHVYGIRFEVPVRGPSHPSSTVSFVVKPMDMVQSIGLSKADLLEECQNQGISVNRMENKRQLAIRLVVWWSAHPEQMREPFTAGFAAFLLEIARRHVNAS